MAWLLAAVVVLVIVGSVLAVAEAATSRMTRVRALALMEEGRRNAALLEQIQSDPSRCLNSIYLAVMFVQNGSAILVAIVADKYFDDLGITLVAAGFTLVYFVIVEAMSKTYGILHSDRAALVLAPVVWLLGRVLALPTRVLIGIANVLLPGKGLKQGPFVSQHDIRSMAEVGHEEGGIEESEKEMIHSIFKFGDTVVGEVMVPRPDIVAVPAGAPLGAAVETALAHGLSRLPVYGPDLDHVEGVLHIRDALKALHEGRQAAALSDLMRPVRFTPESKRAADMLREMQHEKFHLALVVDEYGSVAGLVTLEDLLEELVGEIAEEHEQEAREIEPLGDGRYRVDASLPVDELNELLGTDLPRDQWNTVGGLMFGLLGAIPAEGQAVALQGFRLAAEKVQRRRVTTILVTREPAPSIAQGDSSDSAD
jgi:CBS domain containing-hemolysin-like protein